jgi:hypothetical protein
LIYLLTGKFAQRCNLRKTTYVREPHDFFKLLIDSSVDVLDAFLISEDVLLVHHQNHNGFVMDSSHSNIAVAAFTTAQARLKLYELLEVLGPRVIYFDTDSVIFSARPQEYVPPTGSFLGELTDEVAGEYGPECYINKVVAAGPKCYSYTVFNPNTNETFYSCKIKGITLHYKASQHINFERMRDLVINKVENSEGEQGEILVPQLLFKTTGTCDVSTVIIKKKFRIVYDKRVIRHDFTTVPFGYLTSV